MTSRTHASPARIRTRDDQERCLATPLTTPAHQITNMVVKTSTLVASKTNPLKSWPIMMNLDATNHSINPFENLAHHVESGCDELEYAPLRNPLKSWPIMMNMDATRHGLPQSKAFEGWDHHDESGRNQSLPAPI